MEGGAILLRVRQHPLLAAVLLVAVVIIVYSALFVFSGRGSGDSGVGYKTPSPIKTK
jgi:hypothetical protein